MQNIKFLLINISSPHRYYHRIVHNKKYFCYTIYTYNHTIEKTLRQSWL